MILRGESRSLYLLSKRLFWRVVVERRDGLLRRNRNRPHRGHHILRELVGGSVSHLNWNVNIFIDV